jgi:RNA polymerase sigma-70 factor (ECF subfamily)
MDRPSGPEAGRELPPPEALILRAAGGDRSAMEMLIGRYQAQMARFVMAQTGDGNQCEDLCQIVFVKMVIALPRLREVERFEPWLYQIARNACRDHLRARHGWRRLFVAFGPAHEAAAAQDPQPGRVREESIAQGIGELPAEQQKLLRLSLDKQTSYEELARLSNVSVSAVKSRLHRARENLRGILLAGDRE